MLAIGIGLLVGLVLGLTGAGGSVLAMPLLMHGLGIAPTQAAGIALGAVSLAAATGLAGRHRRGEIVWLPALVLAATGVIAAPCGVLLARRLPEPVLLLAFVVLMLAIASRMIWQSVRSPEASRAVRADPDDHADDRAALCRFSSGGQFELRTRCVAGLAIAGIVSGMLSGLFGVGGGFIIVPMLMLLTGVTIHQAIGSSLAVIALVAGSGFVTFLLTHGAPQPALGAATALGSAGGMLLGSGIARRVAGPHLQQFLAVLIILVAASLALNLDA